MYCSNRAFSFRIVLFPFSRQRKQQPNHFRIILLSRCYLVSFQEKIVGKVLYFTDDWGIPFLPIAVLFLVLLNDFGTDGLHPCLEILFRQEIGSIGEDVWKQSEVTAILKSRRRWFGASPIRPIVGLGFIAYTQQVRELMSVCKGVLHFRKVPWTFPPVTVM